jgi:hypothetical protein
MTGTVMVRAERSSGLERFLYEASAVVMQLSTKGMEILEGGR